MKAAISGETLGSVMELDEILSLFQKNGIHFIEIWPENIPVKVGKTLLHKRFMQWVFFIKRYWRNIK